MTLAQPLNLDVRLGVAGLTPYGIAMGTPEDEVLSLTMRGQAFAGDGNDLIEADQVQDVSVYGGNGEDTVIAGSNVYVNGGAGSDTLLLGSQSAVMGTTLNGGDGTDTLSVVEASGQNILLGAAGFDTLRVVEGRGQLLFGGSGNDRMDASTSGGSNRLYGGSGDDELLSGGSDRLYGGDGDDTLFAGQGGDNILWGGTGKDTFYLVQAGSLPDKPNVVKDFEVGIDRFAFGSLAANQVTLAAQNGDTLIQVGSAIITRVEGITPALLSINNPNQFIFA